MASNWYISSTTGNDTNGGTSWADARATMTGGLAIGGYAAGDTFYVAQDHAETQASVMTLTFKGTTAAPDRVICVNRLGSVPPVSADLRPPTLAAGVWTPTATVSTTAANSMTFTGGAYVYIDGIVFQAGSGASVASLIINSGALYFKNSGLWKLSTAGGVTAINISGGNAAANSVTLDNTSLKFGSTSDQLAVRSGIEFLWKNTASAIQGAVPGTLINTASANVLSLITLDGVDLSAAGAGKNIFGTGTQNMRGRLSNCKLGTSVAIAAASPGASRGCRFEVLISDSAATGYRQEIYDYAGTLTAETTIVRSGGASDGVQSISHKVVSTANAKTTTPFESFPLAIWNDDIGVSKTLTVEIVNDGTTLTNAEIWLEAEYLASATVPQASLVSSGVADVLAVGVNVPASTATWAPGAMASPIPQYLSVTFTAQMKGFVRAVVKIARASKTIYVDPKLTLG